MEKSWHNLTIALAGAVQAINLVEQLAKTGYLNTGELATSVSSLFQQNPESTAAVFDGIQHLHRGFDVLENLLKHHRDPSNNSLLRYMLGVLHLQKRLARRADMLQIIGNRIDNAHQQSSHFGPTHDNVIANIAEIYTDTISKLPYRIQVTGEPRYLQQQRVANQIRTLLLAAIRAVTLWRQVGGSRWQLLLYRGRLASVAAELAKQSHVH